jgi:Family of unknown function (DUF6459)
MPTMPSPSPIPPERRARPNGANVIKWMQAPPASPSESGPPGRPDRPPPCRKAAPCTAPGPVYPLPDPSMARLCAVPDSAPPYDDEAPATVLPIARPAGGAIAAADRREARPARQAPARQAPARQAPARQAPARQAPARQAPARQAPARQAPEGPAPAATGPSGAGPAGRAKPGPSPKRARPTGPAADEATQPQRATPPWPSQFAHVLAETLAGARASHQLTPWTTERARGHIRRLGPLLSASRQPRVRRVVASNPADGIVELTVVVNFGPRVRALAVRLERTQRGTTGPSWLCTAIEAA